MTESVFPGGKHTFLEVYEFTADRMRQLTQELIVQAGKICVYRVSALEKMIRFHLASIHFGEIFDQWCGEFNMERLVNMLFMLEEIYEKAGKLEDLEQKNEILKNKAEFTFYLSVLGKIGLKQNPENSQIIAISLFHTV